MPKQKCESCLGSGECRRGNNQCQCGGVCHSCGGSGLQGKDQPALGGALDRGGALAALKEQMKADAKKDKTG
jgi:hypothetical protein